MTILAPASRSSSGAASALRQVQSLQERINGMQSTSLQTRAVPTLPEIAGVLPSGSLREGAVYSAPDSLSVIMGLLAAASQAGSWCAVVGIPNFGVEAAASHGIELSRLALVPHPGDQWVSVVAALADVIPLIAVAPPSAVSAGEASRLAARLRQRNATLISTGEWPQSEATIRLLDSRWHGLDQGHGHLHSRQVQLAARGKTTFARPATAELWFPHQHHGITADTSSAIPARPTLVAVAS